MSHSQQPRRADAPVEAPEGGIPEGVSRVREAADATTGRERWVLLTHLAREWGEAGRPDRAHAVLDEVERDARGSRDTEVLARLGVERAWLYVAEGGDVALDRAAAHARDAAGLTASSLDRTPLGGLHVGALRLLARLADEPHEQAAMLRKAVSLAGSSADPEATAWRPRLLIDLGRAHYLDGRVGPARLKLNEAVTAAIEAGDDPARDEAAELVAWIEADLRDQAAHFQAQAEQQTAIRPRRADQTEVPAPRRAAPGPDLGA